MKTSRLLLGFLFGTSLVLPAQEPPVSSLPASDASATPGAANAAVAPAAETAAAPLPASDPGAQPPATLFTAEQLEQLVGPIALYPDALVALILPASTNLGDLVLAARYVQGGGDLGQVEHRAWDASVKSLVHYPEVLKWLDANLDWTKQLGEAFAAQPADVMNALQRLRAKAQANGALVDTPQQQVLVEQSEIRIVPAQPDVIYVPTYDPTIVYLDRPLFYSYGAPALRFGPPCSVGAWLAFEFNWSSRSLWIGDRHRHWPDRHDWRRPLVPIAPIVSVPGGPPTHLRPSRPWTPPRPLSVAWSTPIHRAWQASDSHAAAPSRSIRTRPGASYPPPVARENLPPPQTIVRVTPPPTADAPNASVNAPAFRRRETNDARGWDSGRRTYRSALPASGPAATVLPSAPSVSYVSPPAAAPQPAPERQAHAYHAPRSGFSAPPAAQATVTPPAAHLPPPATPQYAPPPTARAPAPPPANNSDSGNRPAPQDPDSHRRDRRHID